MTQVVLVIHLLIALALVAVVLLQRSEGGALGIGGGGGFMTGRGAANLLTRATAVLAAMFFATSIILTILARQTTPTSIFNDVKGSEQTQQAPAASGETKSEAPSSPAPGATETPATPGAPLSK